MVTQNSVKLTAIGNEGEHNEFVLYSLKGPGVGSIERDPV